jgi:hypothetical protein
MTTSVTKVVGENIRVLRRDARVTLDQFAAVARDYGLAWSSGRLGSLESGTMAALSVETLYTLAVVAGRLTGRTVTLAELLAARDEVTITERLHIGPAALALAVSGVPVPVSAAFTSEGTLATPTYPIRDADRRACADLGVDLATGIAAMARLWEGRPLSAQRDAIAEPGANAQRLGIIARRLKAQLKVELAEGNTH